MKSYLVGLKFGLHFNSMPTGVIFHAFMLSADFFQINFSFKILSGIPSECQIVLIQIRPDILLGLIWVQTVCKCYQQMTLVAGKELINLYFVCASSGVEKSTRQLAMVSAFYAVG